LEHFSARYEHSAFCWGGAVVKTIYSVEYVDLVLMLRKKRVDAGLSQKELAKRLGVKRSFVGKTERGERRIDVLELQAFCRALGIELQAFMTELQERQQRR
jgi:transcriptional regulator with XRE-family HTH domain